MAFDFENLSAVIASEVAEVDTSGNIYESLRWTVKKSQLESWFSYQNRIQGWTITRQSLDTEAYALDDETIDLHEMILRGFYSYSLGSDISFQKIIDDIVHRFRPQRILLGDTVWIEEYPSARPIELRFFGDILCHYCEIRIILQERVTPAFVKTKQITLTTSDRLWGEAITITRLTVKALASNTSNIYISESADFTDNFVLSPGDAINFKICNPYLVHAKALTSGDKIYVLMTKDTKIP